MTSEFIRLSSYWSFAEALNLKFCAFRLTQWARDMRLYTCLSCRRRCKRFRSKLTTQSLLRTLQGDTWPFEHREIRLIMIYYIGNKINCNVFVYGDSRAKRSKSDVFFVNMYPSINITSRACYTETRKWKYIHVQMYWGWKSICLLEVTRSDIHVKHVNDHCVYCVV